MGFYSVSAIKFAILCWDFYSRAARGWAVIQTPGQLLLFVCLLSPLISSTFLILDIKNVFDNRPVPVSQFSCRLLKSERDAAVRASADETLQKVCVPPPPTILQHPPRPPPLPPCRRRVWTNWDAEPVRDSDCCGTTEKKRLDTNNMISEIQINQLTCYSEFKISKCTDEPFRIFIGVVVLVGC